MSFQHIPTELGQLFLIIVIVIAFIAVSLFAVAKIFKETKKEVQDEIKNN